MKNLMNTAPESTPILPNLAAIPTVLRVSSGHKRNGKIAHLPKAIRDKINQWIDDGRTYPQIINDLGDDAKDLKPNHFSEWRKGGYQDYLRHHAWRDQLRLLRENGSDMSELTDGPKFQETLVQIALTEIFRVLQQGELKPDSLNYIRLFNALARLNREALSLRKYNDLLAKNEAALKQLDINREISENEHVAIVDRTDRILEMPRPRGTKAAGEPKPIQKSTSDTSSSRREEAPSSPIENQTGRTSLVSKIENCLDCGSPVPPVPPHSLRRPEDHCPSCGMRLPDIGLCYQPGFDHCLNCGATQPALLPGGERPRPYCHKCGERLHNPEPPTS